MPYNTRRKSLSLPSLGIHVPVQRSSTTSNTHSKNSHNANPSTTTMATPKRASEEDSSRPSKKTKRSHTDSISSTNSLVSEPAFALQASIESDDIDLTFLREPPTVDLGVVNDEVIEACIMHLQQTRNRPHLAKDLAAALATKVSVIQKSANPCGIIASRLASFFKRNTWTVSSPCPMAKELEPVHPRRTYYFLSTCPPLPMHDIASQQSSALVTPSLSSSGSTIEDTEGDRERELSMSPEVDLSSPDFDSVDEHCTVPGSMPGSRMGSVAQRQRPVQSLTRNHRAEEPPLEKDEKEFTQTADGLQKRKARGELISATPVDQLGIDDGMQNEQLFGESHRHLAPSTYFPRLSFLTSPAMRPSLVIPPPMKRDGEAEGWSKLDALLDWDKSPETIELDELDGLLDDY
ncbi:hypothetical protein F5Y18DRAFT_134740 [Xylariaceae sp. FL1019]|nr:hypothetical protein F5Y18DRAFT_134740 [Xylariaceae sp. FL1019]